MGLRGINKVVAMLKKLPLDIQREVKEEVFDTVNAIAKDARQNLNSIPHAKPGDGMAYTMYDAAVEIGKVINTDYSHEGFVGSVHVDAGPMGAYIEFGTGAFAAHYVLMLPEPWPKIAREFYKNGKGKIPAAPYLFPAYIKHTAGFADRISDIVKRAAK